ncbi:unnamed protein product [Didymodactylos carnosus]|uniref:Uncharacterized protein n=1 Tax=Didymodactylos carnosus TaxID=1234261 RepID=A0A815DBG8_9BILA|nr:unnamed protein product [Didymodactylos carnosus]CAF4109619.1 unnamed protein product [Didymodactylos carnosus]
MTSPVYHNIQSEVVLAPTNDTLLDIKEETHPLDVTGPTAGRRQSVKIPANLRSTFGSNYSLISFLLHLIIPILQLYIGIKYQGQCPIQPKIATWMIVNGAVGLVVACSGILIFVALLLLVTVICSPCGICLLVLMVPLIVLSTPFLFGWFLAGNFWIFSVRHTVQYSKHDTSTWCHPTLYQVAYWSIIIAYILFFINCIGGCAYKAYQQKQLRTEIKTGRVDLHDQIGVART